MQTLLTRDISEAARILAAGQLVAFPTETVYGLGARADQADAVARIFDAKDRPPDNPLIVHVAAPEDVLRVARSIPDMARRLMEAFWPGPLTLVLPARDDLPRTVTAGLDTVGVRMPDHALALALLREAGVPVAAPSANRSGRPSPTTWEAVRDDLQGRIEAILQGEPARVGLESSVVDCTGAHPVVLRPGGISIEALRQVVPSTTGVGQHDAATVRSPGTRHPHYRPEARVSWVGPYDPVTTVPEGIRTAGYIGLRTPPDGYAAVCLVPDLEAYASELFRFFRQCEAAGLTDVHCERFAPSGIGLALADRIDRATGT
jgi:L-threonylcarbamoyladenylate synthase